MAMIFEVKNVVMSIYFLEMNMKFCYKYKCECITGQRLKSVNSRIGRPNSETADFAVN